MYISVCWDASWRKLDAFWFSLGYGLFSSPISTVHADLQVKQVLGLFVPECQFMGWGMAG